jgi:hypothetical protein
MTVALHSFMHGLLADAKLEHHGCKVYLVTDNALLASQKDQAHHRSRHRAERHRADLEVRSKSKKNVLDVSDHSKKESRWVSSIMMKTEGISAPQTPPRVKDGKRRNKAVWIDDDEKRKSKSVVNPQPSEEGAKIYHIGKKSERKRLQIRATATAA